MERDLSHKQQQTWHSSCCSAFPSPRLHLPSCNKISQFHLLDPSTRSRHRWQYIVRRILKPGKSLFPSSPKQLTFHYDIDSYLMNFDDGRCNDVEHGRFCSANKLNWVVSTHPVRLCS